MTEQLVMRCPACDGLTSTFETTANASDTQACNYCGAVVPTDTLVRGKDGIWGVRPSPPEAWDGRFLARYADGQTSDFDLNGTLVREGDVLPNGHILDQWDVSEEPVADGRFMVIGLLRPAGSA